MATLYFLSPFFVAILVAIWWQFSYMNLRKWQFGGKNLRKFQEKVARN